MAYNHGREDRKWRIWKEAEEKLLRECGVDEATIEQMGETETVPTVITKWLNEYRTTFLSENRICYQYSRRKDGRRIALARRAGDSGDGGDSDIRIPPCYCH